MSATRDLGDDRMRCLGCGYYANEVDQKSRCVGGYDYQGHHFIPVDEAGMSYAPGEEPTHRVGGDGT